MGRLKFGLLACLLGVVGFQAVSGAAQKGAVRKKTSVKRGVGKGRLRKVASYAYLPLNCDSTIHTERLTQASHDTLRAVEQAILRAFDILHADEKHETNQAPKAQAVKMLISQFNRGLHVAHSFAYPFDSIQAHVSIVYPRDSSFRIFTWQYSVDQMQVMKQGVIQMNTRTGQPVIFPLLDRSRTMARPLDTVTDNLRWVGAMYYEVLSHNVGNKRVYTLLGIDENSLLSTRKYIEILHFSPRGTPVFGGEFFFFPPEQRTLITRQRTSTPSHKNKGHFADMAPLATKTVRASRPRPTSLRRFMIEYNKQTVANLRYDDQLQMIIFDHLEPSDPNTKERKYTYSIDGDYEGFVWEKKHWKYVEQVFDFSLSEEHAPRERPVDFRKQKHFYDKMLRQ